MISSAPHRWSRHHHDAQRVVLWKYPYSVVYREDERVEHQLDDLITPSHRTMLTFELTADASQLDVHADEAGIRLLINELHRLLETATDDHFHLMTPGWGGQELSEDRQSADSSLVNKVTVHRWTREPANTRSS
jgi:hypothetical protein